MTRELKEMCRRMGLSDDRKLYTKEQIKMLMKIKKAEYENIKSTNDKKLEFLYSEIWRLE